MAKSAVEIVRAYGVQAWTEGRDDWIPELCADPIVRHDANREVRLSHAEQRARMRHNYEELRPVFEEVVLAGDDEYVTLVWNVTGRDPAWKLCGIEVFRVVDGRIAEVWNSTYMDGRWGLSKSLGAGVGGAAPRALPLLRAALGVEGGRAAGMLVVPVETEGLALWLAQLLGAPVEERAGGVVRQRFAAGGVPAPMTLTVADSQGPSLGLAEVAIDTLSIDLERSGLVNATVLLSAALVPPQGEGPFLPDPPVRLADTYGRLSRPGLDAEVANADIAITAGGAAHGRVSLRLADPDAAAGEGDLVLGWREADRALAFEGRVRLSAPLSRFEDAGVVQATYEWNGARMAAVLTGPDV